MYSFQGIESLWKVLADNHLLLDDPALGKADIGAQPQIRYAGLAALHAFDIDVEQEDRHDAHNHAYDQ